MGLFIIRLSTLRSIAHYRNIFRALLFYFDIKNIAQSQGPILIKNLNFLHLLSNYSDFLLTKINIIGPSGVFDHYTFIAMTLIILLKNI